MMPRRAAERELEDVAVDGCVAKAPRGGERAGPSPVVDRLKSGLKRSVATEYIDTYCRALLFISRDRTWS